MRLLQRGQEELLQLHIVLETRFFCAHHLVRVSGNEIAFNRKPELRGAGSKNDALFVDDVVRVLLEAQQRAAVVHAPRVPEDGLHIRGGL